MVLTNFFDMFRHHHVGSVDHHNSSHHERTELSLLGPTKARWAATDVIVKKEFRTCSRCILKHGNKLTLLQGSIPHIQNRYVNSCHRRVDDKTYPDTASCLVALMKKGVPIAKTGLHLINKNLEPIVGKSYPLNNLPACETACRPLFQMAAGAKTVKADWTEWASRHGKLESVWPFVPTALTRFDSLQLGRNFL